jgi:NADH-quinone oxidoreductase subunit J
MITQAIFYFFAALATASAIQVIRQKNVMHSVLYLAFTVLATSGIFFTLRAEYLGAIQILVYAGGIVVLYIFVIIITNVKDVFKEKRKLFPRVFIIVMPVLLFVEIMAVLFKQKIRFSPGSEQGLQFKPFAQMLLSSYVIPFEIASILLLVVLVGAIIIARRKLLHDPD